MQRIRIKRILWLSALCIFLFGRCKDKYVSPYKSPPTGYLVVEGYIAGNAITRISLSRTFSLSENVIPAETGAQVSVEGDDNSTYSLPESGGGQYGTDTLPLNTAVKYRIHIQTQDGKNYQSDFVTFKTTPAIDSVGWTQDANGVDLYVNTHDPANATHYYQWLYNETWEYHSAEASSYRYDKPNNQVLARTPAEEVYACYQVSASSALLLGSSTKLADDVIYRHPLEHIAANTTPLSVLFSILVHQYALTEEGYNYLTLMQKNTESLGSIFDAQPSVLKGNIHSLNNPGEEVVGYISAGTVTEKRIFIYESDLRSWTYRFSCPIKDTLVPPDPDSLKKYYGDNLFTPLEQSIRPSGWISNLTSCVDCRALGGTTTKPSFWPN